jgi:hypothetical protein
MSEKKEIEIWGRPLEKMTTKDLKAAALQAGGLSGVSGMKKEQLVDALRKAKDIEAAPMKKTDASTTRQLKAQIRAMQSQRMAAVAANNRPAATILRRRIARLKKKTRHASA